MTRRILLALVGLMALGTVAAFAAADVTGDWDFTMTGPRGNPRTLVVTMKQDGEKLTVTMPPMREGGQPAEGTGTVKGNDIEWTVTRTTPRGEITVTYKGTIDGSTMKGTAQMGDRGSMEWTAKKKA